MRRAFTQIRERRVEGTRVDDGGRGEQLAQASYDPAFELPETVRVEMAVDAEQRPVIASRWFPVELDRASCTRHGVEAGDAVCAQRSIRLALRAAFDPADERAQPWLICDRRREQ